MLKIDESVWRVVIPVGISVCFALLVLSVISAIIPAPYFDYEQLPETQVECEAVGGVWQGDMYGEFCDTWEIEAQAYAVYQVVYLAISLVVGLIVIAAALFLIKNRTIAYGLLGAGTLIVISTAGTVILISPITTVVSLAIITVTLIILGLKKIK